MAKNLNVQIILAAVDKGVSKTFSAVGSAFDKVERAQVAFNRTAGNATSIIGSLRNQVVGLASAYIGLGALVKAKTIMEEADQAAFNLEASLRAANREFNNIGTTQSWAENIAALRAELQVYSETDLRNAISRTVDMTKRLGMSEPQMVRIIRLTADLSAGKTDLSSGVERVTSALRGEAESSEYLGLTLNENYVKAWHEANNAHADAWKNLTDLEKAQVRYQVLLEQADPMQGRAAASANTFAGAMKVAKSTMTDAIANSEDTTSAMQSLAGVLRENAGELAGMATGVINLVARLVEWLVNNRDIVASFAKFAGGVLIFTILFSVIHKVVLTVKGLSAALVVLTGTSLGGWLTKMRFWFGTAELLATGLHKAIFRLSGVLAAFGVGWAIGTWLNKFEIVQKAGIAMAAGVHVAILRMKQAWAWASGGDVGAVQEQIERTKDTYAEMFAEVGRKASTSAKKQKDAHKEVADAAGDSADKQTKALTAAWDAFENRLKSAQRQLSLARSAAELAAAEKALEYAKSGMDDVEAEALARKDKVALLDAEIARYRELLRLVPAAAPKGKSSDDSRAQIEQQINGLLTTRVGLLRDGVEAERKASEERIKKLEKERDAAFKLAEEKARFASHERILAMEEEKLEASKLPTILARAQAEMAIDRRISEERIRLKIAEIAALKSLEGVDPANIIQAEQALLDLRAGARRTDLENERAIAAERLTILERSWRSGATSAEEYRQAATRAKELGLMEQRDLDEKMVASGNDLSAALSMGWSRAMEKMKTDAEVMTEIGAMLPEQLAGGMVSAFDSFIERSKTAKEAFIDFARSTINMISQMILKQIILNAISSFGGGGMADGGPVQKLASGGKVHGSSPNDRADNVPIWATAGEYMQPVRAVRHYGTAFMEAVRSLRFPADLARSMALASLPAPRFSLPSFHLASGGPVPRAAAAPASGNSTHLQVVNVLDKGLVGDYLSTSHGETTILNMIRRNGTTIKAMLG